MKKYLTQHYRIFGLIGSIAAFIVAAVYLKVVPEEAAKVEGIPEIILLYAHTFCWILLGVASILWALNRTNKWSKVLAYVALLTYVIFVGTLFVTKIS